MHTDDLLQYWEQEAARPFQGWDFSYLAGRYTEDQPPWSYEAHIRTALPLADTVLDIGTGGGEKLLEFRDALPPRTIATEGYPPNIPVARANLAPHGIAVIPYNAEADARMPFAAARFALIIDRHEAYDPLEIARVLRPGGVFCTQQVDGRNLDDLHALFGMTTAYPHINLAHCRRQLADAGLQITAAHDWQGRATFADVGALVYYLRAIPWEAPPDFSVRRYRELLLALHHGPPLVFSVRRFYLQARKPE